MSKTSQEWELPSRRRELAQGKAPREVTFCLDEREQAEYRRRWLEGEEIADIRRDIDARKDGKQHSHASWGPAGDVTEPHDEPTEPTPDRWASDAFDGSRPIY